MALITRAAKYSDLFEWQLYNAAAVGMGLTGENYLYNNPLTCRGGITRKAWYAVPCCPSNLSRTWADLGKYIYSTDQYAVWIHQYIGSQAKLNPGGAVDITIESELPWNGQVLIKVNPSARLEFTLYLRLPSWSAKPPTITVWEGKDAHQIRMDHPNTTCESTAQGYDPRQSVFLPLQRLWSPGEVIELAFEMPITLRRAHPRVKRHQNKAALTRGPLVYCLESVDNPGVDIFSARLESTTLHAEYAADLLGGITLLSGQTTDGATLTFIPYHLWANRGESQMTVWVNV